MSTSFLYHAFGLPGYDYVRQEFVGGNIFLHVRPKGTLVCCPCCRSRNVVHRGVSERWLRTVPVGFKPVWLVVEVPRIGCASCGLVRRIELRIAEPRRRHTKAFERFVLALTKAMTMLDVSRLLDVGWDVVKDILSICTDDLPNRS
jgi:transposase